MVLKGSWVNGVGLGGGPRGRFTGLHSNGGHEEVEDELKLHF